MQIHPQENNEQAVEKKLYRLIAPSIKFLKESSIALLITIAIASFAGLVLSSYREFLLLLPGLVILIPGAIDMRGNIFGAMGARLGSSFHLGELDKTTLKNDIIKTNTYSSILLSIFLSLILAFFAKIVSILLGIKSISIFEFVGISMIGGMISAGALIFITISIYKVASIRGWDPDNVTAPAITSMGDLITIPSIIVGGLIIMHIRPYVQWFAHLIIIGTIVLFLFTLQTKENHKKIVLHSLIIMTIVAVIGICAGLLLEHYIERLAVVPSILILLPTFIGGGGSIGSIFASKLTTSLHLGMTKPDYTMDKGTKRNVVNLFLLCLITFPVAGAFAYLLGNIFGLVKISLGAIMIASLIAGLILVGFIIIIVFWMAVFFYKKSVDPDNVLIPVLTAIADVFGIFCLIIALILTGII